MYFATFDFGDEQVLIYVREESDRPLSKRRMSKRCAEEYVQYLIRSDYERRQLSEL